MALATQHLVSDAFAGQIDALVGEIDRNFQMTAKADFDDADETTSAGGSQEDASASEGEGASSALDLSKCPAEGPVTVMIKNIHYKSSQESIMRTLNGLGFEGTYDAIYAPGNPARKTNLGYAFIQFLHVDHLKAFHKRCDGRPFDAAPATKPCTVIVSAVQGIRGPKSMQRKKAGKRMDAVEPLILAKPAVLSHALEQWGAPLDERPPIHGAQLASADAEAFPCMLWSFGQSLPVGFREPPGLERFCEIPGSPARPRDPLVLGQVSEQSLALGSLPLRLSV